MIFLGFFSSRKTGSVRYPKFIQHFMILNFTHRLRFFSFLINLIGPINPTKRSYGTKTTLIYPDFYQRNVPMGQGHSDILVFLFQLEHFVGGPPRGSNDIEIAKYRSFGTAGGVGCG